MPITEAERQKRKGYIGSSDMAAILGLSKWKNAYDVWLDKTRKVDDEDIQSEAAEAGTIFEPGVINWAEKELGPLDRNVEIIVAEFHLIDHLDAQKIDGKEPVEAKTAGLFGPLSEDWGEGGTDELPDSYIVQCHHHMICTNKEICYVPAFLGGRGFVMFHVNKDQTIADTVMEAALDFWDHVEADDPPANIVPSVEFVKRLKRIPDKVVDLDPDLVTVYDEAKDKIKWAEAIKDDAYAALITALGDAEAGLLPDGSMMTFFEQARKDIDKKRLKEEMPEIAAKYMKESRFRVLRHKKSPKVK